MNNALGREMRRILRLMTYIGLALRVVCHRSERGALANHDGAKIAKGMTLKNIGVKSS